MNSSIIQVTPEQFCDCHWVSSHYPQQLCQGSSHFREETELREPYFKYLL